MEVWLNHVKNTAARDMFPPQLISQGRREGRLGGQGTLYSKRDRVPTPPPLSLGPSRRGRPAQYPFVTEQMEGQCLAKFRLWQLPN